MNAADRLDIESIATSAESIGRSFTAYLVMDRDSVYRDVLVATRRPTSEMAELLTHDQGDVANRSTAASGSHSQSGRLLAS